MSVVMKRRPWVRRMIVSAVAMAMVGGAVVGGQAIERAVNRDPYAELWMAQFRGTHDGYSAALDARFASEVRDPAFAADRERFLRERVIPAAQTHLPGVQLGDVDCRQTMCRWTMEVPDQYSGWTVMSAPWTQVGHTRLPYVTGATEVELFGILAVPEQAAADAAIVEWFERATPEAMLHHFTAQGRTDADFVHMLARGGAASLRR